MEKIGAMDATTTPPPDRDKTPRWPKHAVWIGMVITVSGALSYFLHFVQFPVLRDVPWLNLPLSWLGLLVCGAGCWRVVTRGRGALGKGLAGMGFLLTLGVAGLFNWYVLSFSYQLPEAAGALAVQEAGPDFTLLDHNGESVSLSDFRGRKVILVFYRGFW